MDVFQFKKQKNRSDQPDRAVCLVLVFISLLASFVRKGKNIAFYFPSTPRKMLVTKSQLKASHKAIFPKLLTHFQGPN